MRLLLLWMGPLSLLGILFMGVDKSRAKRKTWRIPERFLFLWSLIGGAIGIWAGMYVFRHKTQHASFVWGVPGIIALHMAVGIVVWQWDWMWRSLTGMFH